MSTDASSLVAYLEASAARHPDRIAVVDPFGQRLTYAELDDRANRVAAFLRDRGVGVGDRVGVIARKSEAVVTALFGIMKAGGAYVPADYTAPIERNTGILTDCQVKVAFLDPACLAIGGEQPPFERVALPVPKVRRRRPPRRRRRGTTSSPSRRSRIGRRSPPTISPTSSTRRDRPACPRA